MHFAEEIMTNLLMLLGAQPVTNKVTYYTLYLEITCLKVLSITEIFPHYSHIINCSRHEHTHCHVNGTVGWATIQQLSASRTAVSTHLLVHLHKVIGQLHSSQSFPSA